MNVWLRTLWFVDTRYNLRGKDDDRYVLRDGCFSIVWEKGRIRIAKRIIVGVGIIHGERRVFRVKGRGCNGCRRARGCEVVGYDRQRKEGCVVFLGQADGGRGGGESGAESALEGCKGYTEVYGVIFDGGLDGVGFEDGVLISPSQ